VELVKKTFSGTFHHFHQFASACESKIHSMDQALEKGAYNHLPKKVAYIALRIFHALPYVALWTVAQLSPFPVRFAIAGVMLGLIITKPSFFKERRIIHFQTGMSLCSFGLSAFYISQIAISTIPKIYIIMTAISLFTGGICLLSAELKRKKLSNIQAGI
jgi:hypothetical protein